MPPAAAAPAPSPARPPAPASGASLAELEVLTDPIGATVRVDGVARGNAPITLEVSPGLQEVTLEKKGFEPLDLKVSLQPGGF